MVESSQSKMNRPENKSLQSTSLHDSKESSRWPTTPATEREEDDDLTELYYQQQRSHLHEQVQRSRSFQALVSPTRIISARPKHNKSASFTRDFFLRHRHSPSVTRRKLSSSLRLSQDASAVKESLKAAIDTNEPNRPPAPPLLTDEELQVKKAHALKGIRKLLKAQKEKEQADKRRLLDFLRQHDHQHPPPHHPSQVTSRNNHGATSKNNRRKLTSATRTVDTLEDDEDDVDSLASLQSDDAAVDDEEEEEDDEDELEIPTANEHVAVQQSSTPSYPPRRTPRQRAKAQQAHKTLRSINMKQRLNVLRQTAHQALAKHAARQALKRELKLNAQSSSSSSTGSKRMLPGPPIKPSPDRVLLMKQAVKDALLRSHSHETMGAVAQELLASAARKNFKKRSILTLQRVARGFLARTRLRNTSNSKG
jgi:hypothetical protein